MTPIQVHPLVLVFLCALWFLAGNALARVFLRARESERKARNDIGNACKKKQPDEFTRN